MKNKIACLMFFAFVSCIIPTHTIAERFQPAINNFLSKYTHVHNDEIDTEATRFNPCIKSIASRVCIIDSKIDHLNPGVSSGCDQLEAALESCCEILNSKIDITNSILGTFNLSTIELISSEIEVLASKAEQAVSNVEIIVSLSEIVEENLVSFVEIISNIENTVASCCAATDTTIESCCTHLEDVIESCCSIPDSSITSCCEQLGSQLTVIESKIDNLHPTANDSCCEIINSKLDAACGATAIHQSDVLTGGANGYLITQPGHYCVAENLQGTGQIITISASDVHLDLNGYELFASSGNGIGVDGTVTHSGIVIENGFIVGNHAASVYGIVWIGTARSFDLSIEDISIRNFSSIGTGININNVSNVKLLTCDVSYNSENISIVNCDNILINQCFVDQSTQNNGALFQNCASALIQNSSFSNNALHGLRIAPSDNSTLIVENTLFNNNNTLNVTDICGVKIEQSVANAKFVQCSFSLTHGAAGITAFQRNGLKIDGVFVPESVYLENCQAHNNFDDGFFFNNVTRVTLLNCQATNSGFLFSSATTTGDGFHFNLVNSMEMQNCYAAQNIRHGYFLNGVNASLFTNCVAERNTKPFGSGGSGFNIASSIDIVLDHCSALQNQTNGFTIGAVVTGLLKECTALGNGGLGFSDTTASTPVQYYANNSCNNTGGNYSLSIRNQNHAPVTSPANARGVDNIDCSNTALDQIDLIQSCCDTINSKIDHLSVGSIDSCCAALDASIDSCCEQVESQLAVIESKIDTINLIAITSCCDRLEDAIASCCAQTDAAIDSCCEQLQSCCETINSKLDAACSATAIHQSDVDMDPINGYVITQPGHYCVAENLVGGNDAIITISTSDVTLDLNGYELAVSNTSSHGIKVDFSTSHTGIVIRNGFIVGAGAGVLSGQAYAAITIGEPTVTGTSSPFQNDITLSDISVRNFEVGILANRSLDGIIENCHVEDNQYGILILSSHEIKVLHSNFFNNDLGLIFAAFDPNQFCHNIYVEDCLFESASGGTCLGINFTACGKIINCQAYNNAYIPTLSSCFEITGLTSDILFKNCQACNFETGFEIAGNNSATILDSCIAQFNNTGFLIEGNVGGIILDSCIAQFNGNGFMLNNDFASLIKNCSALHNGFGFKDSSTAQNLYENNTACDNAVNYDSTIVSAPVTSPANARGVMNVDCSNSDLDQIDEIQSCCDFLQNCCQALDSKIDVCCMQINSKLDLLLSM